MDTLGQNEYKTGQNGILVKDSMLETFFINELMDIYGAENQIVKALPKMQDAASSPKLKQAFIDHLQVTFQQISRLEEVFERLSVDAEKKDCEAMEGIIDECETIIDETEVNTATRDVGLIMAAQKVEHYEIASYGTLVQLARTLGHEEVAELLKTTLNEEMETDRLLTDIAKNDINYLASEETDQETSENHTDYSSTTATPRLLTATFEDLENANGAYKALETRGYTKDDVNIAMSDTTRDRLLGKNSQTELGKAMEGAGTGSAIGGALGAVIGAVAAIGTSLLIPGLGLVIAGPIAGALAGAGAGGFTGGLAGMLVKWGLTENHAKEYEENIKKGKIVMGVRPKSTEDATFIDQIWSTNNGTVVVH